MFLKIFGGSVAALTVIYQAFQGSLPVDFEGWVVLVSGLASGAVIAFWRKFRSQE